MVAGIGAGLKVAGLFLKNAGCKVVCGKLPKANSMDPAVWNKWTAGLADPMKRDLEIGIPGLTTFTPGSAQPDGFRISFASPDRDNDTAVFEWDGVSVKGNLTGFSANATGSQFGNFSAVSDVLEAVFGEWITVDESAPEAVKSTFAAVDQCVDDKKITLQELESILDLVRAQKNGTKPGAY